MNGQATEEESTGSTIIRSSWRYDCDEALPPATSLTQRALSSDAYGSYTFTVDEPDQADMAILEFVIANSDDEIDFIMYGSEGGLPGMDHSLRGYFSLKHPAPYYWAKQLFSEAFSLFPADHTPADHVIFNLNFLTDVVKVGEPFMAGRYMTVAVAEALSQML